MCTKVWFLCYVGFGICLIQFQFRSQDRTKKSNKMWWTLSRVISFNTISGPYMYQLKSIVSDTSNCRLWEHIHIKYFTYRLLKMKVVSSSTEFQFPHQVWRKCQRWKVRRTRRRQPNVWNDTNHPLTRWSGSCWVSHRQNIQKQAALQRMLSFDEYRCRSLSCKWFFTLEFPISNKSVKNNTEYQDKRCHRSQKY